MQKNLFTEAQVIGILKRAETGRCWNVRLIRASVT